MNIWVQIGLILVGAGTIVTLFGVWLFGFRIQLECKRESKKLKRQCD